MQGTVKWFNETKGYGFINGEGKDYFVHFRDIKTNGFKTLRDGDKVEFTPSNGDKGACAKEVVMT